jgi:hypothetical protein
MAITGDRYVGSYEGHSIELVRENLTKQVTLVIDGREVAMQSVALPTKYDLHADFEHGGKQHTVFAHSEFKKLLGLIPYDHDVVIEVDNTPIGLTKVK